MAMYRKTDGPRPKKWSEADTIKFVELYEAEQVLWNVELPEYKMKNARDAAAKRIMEKLDHRGLTVSDIFKKINGLRTTYNQQKMRVNKSIAESECPEDLYEPTLAWYHIADRFLPTVHKMDTINVSNRTTSALKIETSEDTAQSSSCTFAVPFPEVSQSPRSYEANYDDSDNTIQVNQKKRRRDDSISKSYYLEETANNHAPDEEVLQQNIHEDEFDHFGRYIASHLRQLPAIMSLDCQAEITALLIEKRKQHIQDSTS